MGTGPRTAVYLDRFVPGRPAPFATAGERPWKEAIAATLASVQPAAGGAFLELDFAAAPAIGYARDAALDNFCEPILSVLANRVEAHACRTGER